MWMDEDFCDFIDDFEFDYPSRELRCKHCNKRNLAWRKVKKSWVLIEKSGKVHSCHGYEPSLDTLKELAKETLSEVKKDAIWKLFDKVKKRGSLQRLINILSDDDLLDLYACFIRDEQRDHDFPDVGISNPCKNQILVLRKEILRRISTNEKTKN